MEKKTINRYKVQMPSAHDVKEIAVSTVECVAANPTEAVKQFAAVNQIPFKSMHYKFLVYPLGIKGEKLPATTHTVKLEYVDTRRSLAYFQKLETALAKKNGHVMSAWQNSRYWLTEGYKDRHVPVFWSDKDAESDGEFEIESDEWESVCTICKRVITMKESIYTEPRIIKHETTIRHQCDKLAKVFNGQHIHIWAYPDGTTIVSPTKERGRGVEIPLGTAIMEFDEALTWLRKTLKGKSA